MKFPFTHVFDWTDFCQATKPPLTDPESFSVILYSRSKGVLNELERNHSEKLVLPEVIVFSNGLCNTCVYKSAGFQTSLCSSAIVDVAEDIN